MARATGSCGVHARKFSEGRAERPRCSKQTQHTQGSAVPLGKQDQDVKTHFAARSVHRSRSHVRAWSMSVWSALHCRETRSNDSSLPPLRSLHFKQGIRPAVVRRRTYRGREVRAQFLVLFAVGNGRALRVGGSLQAPRSLGSSHGKLPGVNAAGPRKHLPHALPPQFSQRSMLAENFLKKTSERERGRTQLLSSLPGKLPGKLLR